MSTPVAALRSRAQREIDEGLLPACQLALARHGELEVFEAYGDATTATRFAVFSATKPFVAAVVWVLIGRGDVDVMAPVATYLPEFAPNGKDHVTVEQVLLHTSGFPRAPLGPPAWWSREGRLERIGAWRLNWEPGTAYEYHPSSAHWVLAELIYAVTGRDHSALVEEWITRPLGLPRRVLGLDLDDQDDIAPLEVRGEPPDPDELEALLGVREIPVGEVTNEALLGLHEPRARTIGHPGGGGVMTAADLVTFHQGLLDPPDGIWDPTVHHDVTTNVRNHLPDPLLGVSANRTIGLVVAGDDGRSHLRGMGRTVSPRAFGHNGAGGQIAWADPETGISFAYVTNGLDDHWLRLHRRGTALSSLAAAC